MKAFSTRPSGYHGALVLSLTALWLSWALPVQANVYATQVRVNGGITDLNVSQGTGATISYVLNEAATAGVTVDIRQGTTLIQSIVIAAGSPGALKGTNVVVWNGVTAGGQNPAPGTCRVSVTAAATGYGGWTLLTTDFSTNSYCWEPRGIAVNRNTNSPDFGRVFVANAVPGPGQNPGDVQGIQAFQADAAFQGVIEAGDFTPAKLEVGADDRLYVNDINARGVVRSYDQQLSPESRREVLRADNWPTNAGDLNGPFLSEIAGQLYLWMADTALGGVGVRRWPVGVDGTVATNELGLTVVQAGAGSDLDQAPNDVALDRSNQLFTVQYVTQPSSPTWRVFRFPGFDESTNAQMLADWKVGAANNQLGGASGIAVDPQGVYLGVSALGTFTPPFVGWQNGGLRVLAATNGAAVTSLGPTGHFYQDVAWDAAGNVYTVDSSDSVWRAYSPPGTNQFTTEAVASVIVGSPILPPTIISVVVTNGLAYITVSGEANRTYVLQGSTDFLNWSNLATNTSSATVRLFVVSAAQGPFFRIWVAPDQPVAAVLTAPVAGGGQFEFTLVGEEARSYAILRSTNLVDWEGVVTNSATGTTRLITVPAPGARGFYRALSL